MLRLILPITFCLFAVLTALGGVIAREWGWNEYASDDLYVVYAQTINTVRRYFIVSEAGGDAGALLTWENDSIIDVDCSPNGRLFAFFTSAARLYVVDAQGVVYNQVIDPAYVTFNPGLNVANNGTAAFFERGGSGLLVNAEGVVPLEPPQANRDFWNVQISSGDLMIWNGSLRDGTLVYTPSSGDVIAAVPGTVTQGWLASEQIFAFTYPTQASSGTFLMDPGRQTIFHLTDRRFAVSFSPDGRQAADWVAADTLIAYSQVIVYDPLSPNPPLKQVTHEQNVSSLPICFLAFRPAMMGGG
ncbi:MAG: hypothetical protein IT319_21230 [Anaerolineae bacterium]|nr:hypothetical protein [Anaerolineae bacterium]